MRYIFEKGTYPEELVIDDQEFDLLDEAAAHAQKIGADYMWDCPNDRNPSGWILPTK